MSALGPQTGRFHNATPHSRHSTAWAGSRLSFGAVTDWTPEVTAAWTRTRDLDAARFIVTGLAEGYADARKWLGEVNRRCGKNAVQRLPAWRKTMMRRDAMRVLNSRRGQLIRARKALAALEGAA